MMKNGGKRPFVTIRRYFLFCMKKTNLTYQEHGETKNNETFVKHRLNLNSLIVILQRQSNCHDCNAQELIIKCKI